jgi:hypothetical protein
VGAFQFTKGLAQPHELRLLQRLVTHEDHTEFVYSALNLCVDRIVFNVVEVEPREIGANVFVARCTWICW